MEQPTGWYNGNVGLNDLPSDKVYVRLNDSVRAGLLERLKIKSPRHNWNSLAEVLGITLDNLTPFILRKAKIRLSLLLRLWHFAGMSDGMLEDSITELAAQKNSKGILNPNIPFNFNTPFGAIFLSAIFHDGGILKGLQPYYVNMEESQKRRIIDCAGHVYGGINSDGLDAENKQISFPRIFGLVLSQGLGLNHGDKTVQRTLIPEFIMESVAGVKAAFLRQAFDDEGHVSRRSRCITFKSAHYRKSQTIIQVQKLLSDLGIESTVRFAGKYMSRKGAKNIWLLYVCGENNLRKFYDVVGFNIERKHSRLGNLLASYTQHQNKKWRETLPQILFELETEKGYFDYKSLANRSGKSTRQAIEYIRELRGAGKVKRLNRMGHYKLVSKPIASTVSS